MKKDPFKLVRSKLAKERKLVYLDIETSPMKVWSWSLGKQYLTHDSVIEESKVILIQWMFEGDKKVSYLHWDKKHDDRAMLDEFSKIMENVSVAVSQNGKEFDHKILRWRLNLLGLTPLKDVEIFDILKLSQASFRAPSHKLDYRSAQYGLGGKIPMRLSDWIKVMTDQPKALKKMIDYGCKDILDLRKIFWKELPYYIKLPGSLSTLLYPKDRKAREYCPICASKHQSKFDVYPTKIGNKPFMKCNNCGHKWKETRVKLLDS